MRITCRCSSCGGTYQVDGQYAGRKIKCPKCATAIVVTAAAEARASATTPPKVPKGPNPLKVAEKIEAETPAADEPEWSWSARATGSPEAPAVAESEPDEAPEQAGSDAVAVPGLEGVAPKRTPLTASKRKHHGKKKAGNRRLWIALGLGVAALAIAGVFVGFELMSSKPVTPTDSTPTTIAGTTTDTSAGTAAVAVAPLVPLKPSTRFVLIWPPEERSDAVVQIDGNPRKVPPTGPVEYPLEIRDASHTIHITRKGFAPLVTKQFAREGEQLPPYTVKWFRSFDGWAQDFEDAKRQAAAGKKSILILFDGSDWSPNSEPLMREVFSRDEFLNGPGKDSVLVYADFPKTLQGAAKVQSRERNEALGEQFQVKDYPTVVLTQPDGKPIGCLQVHVAVDLKAFLKMFKLWQTTGEKLQALTKDIETAKDEAKKRAICDAWDLLAGSDLERYYAADIEKWKAMLPADMRDRKHPATAAEMEQWTARFEKYMGFGVGGEKGAEEVANFDEWKKTRTFPDPNTAARLHCQAAGVLYMSGQIAGAAKKIDEGLALKPSDEKVRAALEEFKEQLASRGTKEGERLVGRGTGSFFAEGGYLLTNHHVIDKQKKLKVRMPRTGQIFPATLIAADSHVDLALVKAEIPANVKITPVSLLPGVKEGQSICAIGFPTTGDPHETFAKPRLVITQGIISVAPDLSEDGSMIQLDCRVNPGNSGGPLFNNLGIVVGIIRAKNISHGGSDSVGLAIPGEKVVAFLKQNLPAGTTLPTPKPAAKALEWTQLKEQMEDSIVCVLNYQ